VSALAEQGVQIERQRGDERLAFARLHLGDLALVQDDAANKLHVEMALADGAHGSLAHNSESLRQQVVERLASGQARPELVGFGAQLRVGEPLHVRFERVDALHCLAVTIQLALVGVAEYSACK